MNRGYQTGTLKPDGRLAKFTAACGPVVYRGDLFPREFYGAAFVCEPAGNMVRCNFLAEENGMLTATNAFPGREFLASTDERFRPVNLQHGPDGALYIVDMYRGIIQHRIYVTTFLRNQIIDRNLETPLNLGRIYRVVPAGIKNRELQRPALTKLTASELVKQLSATNGWTRDTAQQLLVERRDNDAVGPLTTVAVAGNYPSAIHALWTLHALGEMNLEAAPLAAEHPKVRGTAVRVLESFLGVEGNNAVKRRLLRLTNDPSFDVRLQLSLSLGESKGEESTAAMAALLERDADHPLMRTATLSGLKDREIPFLKALLERTSWNEAAPARQEFIRELVRCVAESRDPARIAEVLARAVEQTHAWQQYAILDGIAALIPAKGKGKEPPQIKPIHFASEPGSWSALKKQGQPELETRLQKIEALLVWPGKAGVVEKVMKPLSASEQKLFDAGKGQYVVICGACHQPNGLGLEGLAPPLVDADWATGSPERLTRIVLHGVRGPMNVKGKVWELEMPALNILTDEELAGLMTYIRREWGHTASPVTPDFVAKVRKETEERIEAWTEPELLQVK